MSEYLEYLHPLLAHFLELKSVYVVHAVDERSVRSVLTARSRDSIKSSELVPGGVHRRAITGSSPLTSSVTLTAHNVHVQLLHQSFFIFVGAEKPQVLKTTDTHFGTFRRVFP